MSVMNDQCEALSLLVVLAELSSSLIEASICIFSTKYSHDLSIIAVSSSENILEFLNI